MLRISCYQVNRALGLTDSSGDIATIAARHLCHCSTLNLDNDFKITTSLQVILNSYQPIGSQQSIVVMRTTFRGDPSREG